MSIKSVSCSLFIYDWEYQAIIRKLAQYGLRPTGNKSSDKMRLHQIEVREAKKEDEVTSRFLTVGKSEQEKIQDKKEEKNNIGKSLPSNDIQLGQYLLGEQMMIMMKIKKRV